MFDSKERKKVKHFTFKPVFVISLTYLGLTYSYLCLIHCLLNVVQRNAFGSNPV